MIAVFNDCAACPAELFIILSQVSSIRGRFVGMESNRHVEDFDEEIRELSSVMSVGLNDLRKILHKFFCCSLNTC